MSNMQHCLQQMDKRKKILDRYVNVNWDVVKNKTVLDIGPAYGIWSMRAIDNGAKSVEAIDIDSYWLKTFPLVTAHLKYKIPITKKNVLELKPKDKYDVVFFLAVWHHIIDYDKALDKVFASAKETILLEGPIGKVTTDNKHKPFSGNEEQHAFYWIPCVADLYAEIVKRGGTIVDHSYNKGKTRMYLQVSK